VHLDGDYCPQSRSRRRAACASGSLEDQPQGFEPAAENVDRSCHENLALPERKSEGVGSSSGRGRCLPILERFASEGAERVAGNKMALNVERVMDDGVNRQEPLR
jgi:hypothetical protein